MNYDRNYRLDKVNLDYAIAQRKMLTEKEFGLTFSKEDYDEYRKRFYQNHIYKFFNGNIDERWFQEKKELNYIKKQEIIENFDKFNRMNKASFPILHVDQQITQRVEDIRGKYLIMSNIPPNYGKEDFKDIFTRVSGVHDYHLTKSLTYKGIERRIFATLSANVNENEIHNLINERVSVESGIDIRFFTVSDEIAKKTSWLDKTEKDLTNLRNILKMLNNQFNTQIKYDSESVDEFITFLRVVFNYCYYCTKLYQSDLEMFFDCGDFHLRDNKVQSTIFDRKQAILTSEHNFEYLKRYSVDTELERYIMRKSENMFSCEYCGAAFDQYEKVVEHLKTSHQDFCNQRQEFLNNLNKFANLIDLNLLMFIDGIDNQFLPFFAVHEHEASTAAKYDLPIVHSGDFGMGQ